MKYEIQTLKVLSQFSNRRLDEVKVIINYEESSLSKVLEFCIFTENRKKIANQLPNTGSYELTVDIIHGKHFFKSRFDFICDCNLPPEKQFTLEASSPHS